jgi:hypothetical protein
LDGRRTHHKIFAMIEQRRQIYMSQAGFEPMIAVFERAGTMHTLDSAGTWVGRSGKTNFLGGSFETFTAVIFQVKVFCLHLQDEVKMEAAWTS